MGVRFGDVQVREMSSHVRQDSAGNYKLGLDWSVRADFTRNIDSWEAERERTRITKGSPDQLHARGRAQISAALAAPPSPLVPGRMSPSVAGIAGTSSAAAALGSVAAGSRGSPIVSAGILAPTIPAHAAGVAALTPARRSSPPAGAASSAKFALAKPPATARIVEHWHVKPDGRVYQGAGEHSSPVAKTEGRLITTTSGSQYWLGEIDPKIRAVLEMTEAPFDDNDPLENAPALLYAERIVYGKAAPTITALDDALVKLAEQLEVPGLTSHHFGVVADVLLQMGISTPKLHAAIASGTVGLPASGSAAAGAAAAGAATAAASSGAGITGSALGGGAPTGGAAAMPMPARE